MEDKLNKPEEIILFVIDEQIQRVMTMVDLTDFGTKAFGYIFKVEVEKAGDINKLIKDPIIAVYCNGKFTYDKKYKMISDGKTWILIEEFPKWCELKDK